MLRMLSSAAPGCGLVHYQRSLSNQFMLITHHSDDEIIDLSHIIWLMFPPQYSKGYVNITNKIVLILAPSLVVYFLIKYFIIIILAGSISILSDVRTVELTTTAQNVRFFNTRKKIL